MGRNRPEGEGLRFDHGDRVWIIEAGWSIPAEHVDLSDLMRAWADREAILRLLEVEPGEVVDAVEELVLAELVAGNSREPRWVGVA